MFIVWRRKPIRSDRRAELFNEIVGGRKVNGKLNSDCPAWTPLYCDHTGPGRVAMTPHLIRSARTDGKPRQELLHRFHSIRELLRRAVARDRRGLVAFGPRPHQPLAIRRRRELALLQAQRGRPPCPHRPRQAGHPARASRGVVPRPTRKGAAEFKAFREAKEAEYRAAEEAYEEAARDESRRSQSERAASEEARWKAQLLGRCSVARRPGPARQRRAARGEGAIPGAGRTVAPGPGRGRGGVRPDQRRVSKKPSGTSPCRRPRGPESFLGPLMADRGHYAGRRIPPALPVIQSE